MTDNTLAGIAGIIISLAFSYIPGLNDKYAKLTAKQKALVMLGSLFVACLVILAGSCLNFFNYVSCDAVGAKTLVSMFVAAIVANQAAYLLTPPAQIK